MPYSNNYIIDRETILFLPRYDEFGYLFTVVAKVDGTFDVGLGPTALIDFNLQYYGSSLRGAGDGARMILGKGNMNPVIVNEKLDLYWFPSKSPYKDDCIWFALHQIKDYIGVSGKRTKIFFNNGSTIIIDMSKATFDKKVQKAYKLKGKLESRTRGTPMKVSESRGSYHIAQNEKERNFYVITQSKE